MNFVGDEAQKLVILNTFSSSKYFFTKKKQDSRILVQNTLKTCLKFGKFQHPSKKEA
jgi:hypothetical protein